MTEPRPDFSFIVRDNEAAAARALRERNFVHAYLLVHAVVESLLRVFLNDHRQRVTFGELIEGCFLSEQHYPAGWCTNRGAAASLSPTRRLSPQRKRR